MRLNFGFYTSNYATRLCRFLDGKYYKDQHIKFVIHDGQPTSALSRLCYDNDIELIYINYMKIGVEKTARSRYLSGLLLEKLLSYGADYCFCFGSRILVGKLLDRYCNRIINFHPSLLPSFPGLRAIDQAIEYGSPLLGNTAHFIDEGVDTGPIIMQSVLPRAAFDGYDSVLDLQIPMLAQIIAWLEKDRISISGRIVQVRNAGVGVDAFVPALELCV